MQWGKRRKKMERIPNNEEMRRWSDHIPLRWRYTAGVAGDRFLQLLKQGKIQGSVCKRCGKTYIPPKIYCKDCFVQIDDWRDVPEGSAYLYSFTELKDSGDAGSTTVALVKFEGFEGGILAKLKLASRETPRIGMKLNPVFKPKDLRKGDLSDISHFEKLRSPP